MPRSFYASMYPESGPRGALAPQPSNTVHIVSLAPNAAKVVVLPSGTKVVSVEATGVFWAKFGASAVTIAKVPDADILDGSGPLLMPANRTIPSGVTHVALISSSACLVQLAFYEG